MNILVVAQYQGDGSPTASFIHDQVKAYVQLGHSVRVLAPVAFMKNCMGSRTMHGFKEIDGIQHYYLRHLSLSNLGQKTINTPCALFAIRIAWKKALADFSPDVIHVHTLGLASELGGYLRSVLKCPLVATTHGSDTFIPFKNGNKDQLKQYAAGVDTVVCVSTLLKKRLIECGVVTPISVILNGFNVQYTDTSRVKKPLTMIQVGSLIPRKNTDITIRAQAFLCSMYPGFTLKVVGSGSEMERLRSLCNELSITDAVRFYGYLPNSETMAEMASSQFFVMPSVREGFGIVYLEAMANGCITIGTEGEGIADLIISGENGFLVPPDDPDAIVQIISWCIDHPEDAVAIVERGRQAACSLTWEKNAKQYVDLFEELIDSCKHC